MSDLHLKESENNFLLHLAWGEDWERTVCKKLFMRHLSKLRRCRTKEEFLAAFGELELRLAHAEAVRLLARKGYFKHDLQQKLLQKGLSEKAVSQALLKFEQQGYLNDEERAQSLIRREFNKGHGPNIIYQLLEQKHFDIDAYRSLIINEEHRSLQAYVQKRGLTTKSRDRVQQQKLIAQLLRRGYSYGTIRSVLDDVEYTQTT